MREIKFRAWDKEEKEMVYDVEKTYDYKCNGFGASESNFGEVLNSNNYAIMQYTGLDDFNGREVYEGDIIEDVYKKRFEIRWLKGEPSFKMYKLNTKIPKTISGFIIICNELKVIGNIYENSELLEEK